MEQLEAAGARTRALDVAGDAAFVVENLGDPAIVPLHAREDRRQLIRHLAHRRRDLERLQSGDRIQDQPVLMLDTGGHQAVIRSMTFTADGKYLVSAGEDKVVRVWDWRAGKTVRVIVVWRRETR